MKHVIAINASPRTGWNTGTLVREAARGAEDAGAQVEVIDLYKLEKFTGCTSCFACKLEPNKGKCVCRDGLTDTLEKIRTADGVILGSPNYLGDLSAGFRALFERLVFQHITYCREKMNDNEHLIPTLLIVTSNAATENYEEGGYYASLLARYEGALSSYVGKTRTLLCGNTLQVNDYSRFNWTLFDPVAKKARHEAVFPQEKQRAYDQGAELVSAGWQMIQEVLSARTGA